MRRRRNRSVSRAAAAGVILGLSTIGLAPAQETAIQVRQIRALTYPEGPTISVKFQGTSRLPRASGEAKVERKKGMTEIEIELDELKPAKAFGGDYNTYVLWSVSPEGHVDNVGEFILQGNRSKLDVSTPLETFGMLVEALRVRFRLRAPRGGTEEDKGIRTVSPSERAPAHPSGNARLVHAAEEEGRRQFRREVET